MSANRKIFRYLLLPALLVLAGYNSVYFEKLDQRQTGETSGFDAESYARSYLNEELPPALKEAVGIRRLLDLLRTDQEAAFENYSHALGIGNIRFFLVKGEGVISAVQEDEVIVIAGQPASAGSPEAGPVRIATEYVFGNAIRDASGLIRIDDFGNTAELNEVSGAINRIIREEVLPAFLSQAEKGKRVRFTGAVELNRKYPDLQQIEVIPITLNYIE